MDIENYPKFLPWCANAKITKQIKNDTNILTYADLTIEYNYLSYKYTSIISHYQDNINQYIDIRAIKGPFKKLNSKWIIQDIKSNELNHNHIDNTKIIFSINLEPKIKFMHNIIQNLFSNSFKDILKSFINQADILYGDKPNINLIKKS